jgi:hypothetical protein
MTREPQRLFDDVTAITENESATVISRPLLERLAEIEGLLRRYSFCFSCEAELQAGLASALKGFEFQREFTLSRKDRIDFLIGDIGLEVKVEGNLAAVTRQLHRYSEFSEIGGLILVTTRMRHGMGLPVSMSGKPLRIHVITSL